MNWFVLLPAGFDIASPPSACRYLQTYAQTKALGEKAMTDACTDEFMTVAVAPHQVAHIRLPGLTSSLPYLHRYGLLDQVYGPRDNLFLPNLLEACGTNRLRVFGDVSFRDSHLMD